MPDIKHSASAVDDEPEDEFLIDHIRLGSDNSFDVEDADVFTTSAKELKTYDGLTSIAKRRITNKLTKFHSGAGNAKSKKNEFDDITGYQAFDVVQPPYNLDYLAKLPEISPAHHAAVVAKVSNIVGLGYKWVESPKTKERMDDLKGAELDKFRKKLSRVRNQLDNWLDGLHTEDEFEETLRKVWTDYENTGNGYLEIGRKNTGEIGYLGHIPSTTVRVRKQRDGFVQIIGNKVVFFRMFGTDSKDPFGGDSRPNEVIHIKKYASTNGYYGIPDIVSAKASLAGQEFATRYNLDYFENKAVPRYAIILKGAKLSTRTENALMTFFDTSLKGKNHRTIYIPLPSDTPNQKVDIRFEAIESGSQDASWMNYRKANLADVLMAEGVPVGKVSQAEGQSLAASRDADKTFKEQKCRPEQRIFTKKLNRIIKEKTNVFIIELNEMSLTDEDTQSKIDERRIKTGTEVANEQRARRGQPGLPGGDKPVDLNAKDKIAQQQAEMRAQGNRARDAERSANASDSDGEARQPKGDGRAAS